jgi:hypothetical protein
MKKLLSIFIITFIFQSCLKADNTKDFQIEGISVGDSLLNYFSNEQIRKFGKVTYPSSDKFVGWETSEDITFKDYDAMTYHVKSKDKTFEIFSMKGMLLYPNKLKECLNKKKEITKVVRENFNHIDEYSYQDDFGKKLGKSIAHITDFDLADGGAIRIWCSVWDKENQESKYWADTLNVSAGTKPFFDFLNNEAYK